MLQRCSVVLQRYSVEWADHSATALNTGRGPSTLRVMLSVRQHIGFSFVNTVHAAPHLVWGNHIETWSVLPCFATVSIMGVTDPMPPRCHKDPSVHHIDDV
jgi:hypothetical protein